MKKIYGWRNFPILCELFLALALIATGCRMTEKEYGRWDTLITRQTAGYQLFFKKRYQRCNVTEKPTHQPADRGNGKTAVAE